MNPFFSSDSSSPSDDEYENSIHRYDVEQRLLLQQMHNNNLILSEFLNSQNATPVRRGSVHGRRIVRRNIEDGAQKLFNDYFSENPTYNDDLFYRRYRMSRSLFLRIVDAVKNHDSYFLQRRNAAGTLGLSTLQKITAAFRILAYATPADAIDEYVRIGESTSIECLKRFCHAIVEIFSDEYIRSPNASDIARLLYIGKERGFPGMLGSLDCMHWRWKNCPAAWAGQYAGRSGHPTLVLEIVADYDLWIWHAYFGMPGSNNDINVLERSHLFTDLARGITPPSGNPNRPLRQQHQKQRHQTVEPQSFPINNPIVISTGLLASSIPQAFKGEMMKGASFHVRGRRAPSVADFVASRNWDKKRRKDADMGKAVGFRLGADRLMGDEGKCCPLGIGLPGLRGHPLTVRFDFLMDRRDVTIFALPCVVGPLGVFFAIITYQRATRRFIL